jgi:carbonic anhydrase
MEEVLVCSSSWVPMKGRRMSVRKVLSIFALLTWAACGVPMNGQAALAPNDFAYTGDTGPAYWSQIKDAYKECAASPVARQSPINIENAVEDPALGPLNLMLGPTPFTLTNPGYTIVATPPFGGTLVLDGLTYYDRSVSLPHTFRTHHQRPTRFDGTPCRVCGLKRRPSGDRSDL